jgi:hypothetical protein
MAAVVWREVGGTLNSGAERVRFSGTMIMICAVRFRARRVRAVHSSSLSDIGTRRRSPVVA